MKNFSIIFTIFIIGIIGFTLSASAGDSVIPDWIKNNAKWWSEGSISEADYITSLEYLIINGIIKIPIPITEVSAASPVQFEKFEIATSQAGAADDPRGRMYDFRDDNPKFFLESLPSADKKQFYEFVGDWMDRGDLLNEFDVDIEVLDGTGTTIQIWEFNTCKITSYGTYLQDTVFIYQFSGVEESEIRDRTHFSCVGIHLRVS